MSNQASIREEVLAKLDANFSYIRERFGIESLGVFGSVARGEDTLESDIDLIYEFRQEYDTYDTYFDLSEYLEELFGRSVDLVSPHYLKPRIRSYVMQDVIFCEACEADA